MTSFKKTIDGKPFEVSNDLVNFDIHYTPESSYVDFFGLNKEESKMFFQFNNGTAFIYNEVPEETQDAALAAESIGKFWHAAIKAKFDGDQIAALSVAPDTSEEESHFADLEEGEEWPDEDEY